MRPLKMFTKFFLKRKQGSAPLTRINRRPNLARSWAPWPSLPASIRAGYFKAMLASWPLRLAMAWALP